MKRMRLLALFIAIVAVALTGCSRQADPVIPANADRSLLSGSTASSGTGVNETRGAPGDFEIMCTLYEISGAVYSDADQSGTRSPSEPGIADVTVTILDDYGTVLQMATTDASGAYSFLKYEGTYAVRIDAATAANDFNETLASSFNATGPTSRTVTLGPDSPGNDFGFDPKTAEIGTQLDQGIILTTGEPARFWQKQIRMAISGGRDHVEFDAATMAQFIAQIQGLFLPDPFRFTPGSEFEEALSILSTKSKDPLPLLRKELLAAELNHVSGKGLVGAWELQRALLAWAESVVIAASSTVTPPASGGSIVPMGVIDTRVADAYDLILKMNGAIGGGSGGGG